MSYPPSQRGVVPSPPPVARSRYPLRCISGQADHRRTRAAATEGPRPILSPLFRAALRPEASPVSGDDRPCGKSGRWRGYPDTGESCVCVPLWDKLTGRNRRYSPAPVWGWGRQRGRAILTLFLPHAKGRLSGGEFLLGEAPAATLIFLGLLYHVVHSNHLQIFDVDTDTDIAAQFAPRRQRGHATDQVG